MTNKVSGVIYQTPEGKEAQGYIIDGKTYKDPYGKTRVDVGSTVPTAGGTYILTANGSVKTPTSVGEDIRKAYRQSEAHLGAAKTASMQGIRAATQKTYDTIKEQRKAADARYSDANRTAYQAYVNASDPYGAAGERQAKLGLSDSGYSETSNLRTANTYQQALSQNALARDAYMRELDTAYRNAKYDGDIKLANAIAEYEKLVYKHGIDAAEAIAKQENTAYDYYLDAEKEARERQKYAEESARKAEKEQSEARYNMLKRAVSLANSGASDKAIAKALGITLEELYTMIERGM